MFSSSAMRAVRLNFDLLFTPLQQPAFKTNCFFLNANLFPRLFQRPALRYRHPDSGIFGFQRQALQISVRFLKFIKLHRYRLKLCLMLIVCAMFRLGDRVFFEDRSRLKKTTRSRVVLE